MPAGGLSPGHRAGEGPGRARASRGRRRRRASRPGTTQTPSASSRLRAGAGTVARADARPADGSAGRSDLSSGPGCGPRTDEDELERIEARCRAKAEAVRWQAESQRQLWEGVETPVEDDVDRPGDVRLGRPPGPVLLFPRRPGRVARGRPLAARRRGRLLRGGCRSGPAHGTSRRPPGCHRTGAAPDGGGPVDAPAGHPAAAGTR